ncbi:MAG: cobalamin-binding protein [Thermodesulfobacteriota bacterium]|nr:cobalamin-binding protein [Thermodesulfobacteriota bacterium]
MRGILIPIFYLVFQFIIVFNALEPFCMVVVDEVGRSVSIPDTPKRIVSLAPSITEILYEIGLEDSIVGVTEYSNYPPRVSTLPKIGTYVNINLERVLELQPDLAIGTADGNVKSDVERLNTFGVPIYTTYSKNIQGVMQSIAKIGEITGKKKEAEDLVRDMKGEMSRIRAKSAGSYRPRVVILYSISPIITAGSGTFADDLIRIAGGKNISGDSETKYPRYSLESIIVKNPEIIIVTVMGEDKREKRGTPEFPHIWDNVQAVREKKVYSIDPDIINRPSPRIIMGLKEMVRIFEDVAR